MPSLWYDEIISAQDTLLNFGHIKHEAEWDKNPPFYHYVLWVWCKLFGISEIGLRSMSAFFSSVTAVLIFVFSSRISNKLNASAATIVFTFHPFLYYYAQEARCFSFLIFLTTVNLMLLYSLVKDRKMYKAFLLGGLNFLIFYTHYLAGLLLFCELIFVLILFRKRWLYLVLIYLTPIILILLRFTKKQYTVLFFSHETSKEKSNVPLAKLDNLVEGLSHLYISNLIFILFFVFIVVFLVKSLKQKQFISDIDIQFKIFIVTTPLVCIAILYLLGTVTNVFHERYLLFCIPCLFLSLFVFSENRIVFYFVVTFIVVFEITNLRFNVSKRMDYKFAATLTKEIQKKEDVYIIIQTHDVVNLFTYYYDRDIFLSKERMSKNFLAISNIYYIDQVEDLKNIHFDQNKPVVMLQTYQKVKDELSIRNYFTEKNYARFTTNQIEGIKFSYLKKKP